jgi:hypothetical protein
MTKKVKLFMVDEKPYLTSLDTPEIGDKAIVTVGGQYPSLVECSSELVLNLITDTRLTLTQAFKVFLSPDQITLTNDQIDKILETDGILEIEEENGSIKYNI